MNFWTEDNAAQFVIAVMRVLLRYVVLKDERQAIVAAAHTEAEKAKTVNQPQYDLAFAAALRKFLLKAQVPASELSDEALLDSQAPQAQATAPVATTEERPPAAAPPRDPNDRRGWTVADWQAAGIAFKPTAFRVAPELTKVLQKPEKGEHHRLTPPDWTRGTEEPPWGVGAVAMVKWAHKMVHPTVLSQQRATELAQVLSYLYYAGVLKEGSILPIGAGRNRLVSPTKQKSSKK